MLRLCQETTRTRIAQSCMQCGAHHPETDKTRPREASYDLPQTFRSLVATFDRSWWIKRHYH